jgi:ppGpp synthetase/RelA/SpoT-type nucleotidyltranferase
VGADVADVADDFVSRYVKEFDFYEQAARIAAKDLESNLQTEGIRCIVTSRAKSVARLEEKIRQRNLAKPYGSIQDVFTDIVDLAGVRVALYFPAEREQVRSVISRLFLEYEPKRSFPSGTSPRVKRFSGYSAVHYRVRLRPQDLSDSERRYSTANIEVQVASVLMHAWAEVEHDLVYKPNEGELSDGEYSLLDQLNGLVLAGEIGLEQLQRAGEARVAVVGRRFANHYELAAHLVGQASAVHQKPVTDAGLGRVDLLFELCKRLGLDTPGHLGRYLDVIHGDLELRPLAEQIIDALLAEDESRYELYRAVRAHVDASRGEAVPLDNTTYTEMGFFLAQWVRLERLLRDIVPATEVSRPVMPSMRVLERLELLDQEMRFELDQLRRLRNMLVHGIEVPPPLDLHAAGERLGGLISEIERRYGTRVEPPS